MSLFPEFAELALEAGNLAFNRKLYSDAEYCYTKAEKLGSPGAVTGLQNIKIIQKDMVDRQLASATPPDTASKK
jgi:hypothetical protein